MTNVVLVTTEHLENLVRDVQEVKALLKKEKLQEDLPELLRTSEVKRILKLKDSSLATLRHNGTLPFIKIAGTVYYKKNDISQLIDNNYSGRHEK